MCWIGGANADAGFLSARAATAAAPADCFKKVRRFKNSPPARDLRVPADAAGRNSRFSQMARFKCFPAA